MITAVLSLTLVTIVETRVRITTTNIFITDNKKYNFSTLFLNSTGGPWYTEQEFDDEFVEELCNFIVQFVNSKGMIDLAGKGNEMIIIKNYTIEDYKKNNFCTMFQFNYLF